MCCGVLVDEQGRIITVCKHKIDIENIFSMLHDGGKDF